MALPLPAHLTTCAEEPAELDPETLTAEDVKAYEVELQLAGDDCRQKLRSVRQWETEIRKK